MGEIRVSSVSSRSDERSFISFSIDLYADCPRWVPPVNADLRSYIRRKHPYFDDTPAEFLLFHDDSRVVGRAAVMENRRYNRQHGVNTAHFYFVDFVDDRQVSRAVFAALKEWAGKRGLSSLTGPLFSGGTMGGGVLIEGFEHRAAMTMMPYNYPYYEQHYLGAGFSKNFDLFSLRADPATFRMPERVESVAQKVRDRGRFQMVPMKNRRELRSLADEIQELYNPTLADHTENYPLTDRELERLKKDLLIVARPDLEKVIRYDGEIVGFILAFPDLSEMLQKNRGRLGPIAILRLLRGRENADKVLFNGMGILQKHQRLGGNALLYSELAKSVSQSGFADTEMVQINEQTELMLSDMQRLGAVPFKRHRVYSLEWA